MYLKISTSALCRFLLLILCTSFGAHAETFTSAEFLKIKGEELGAESWQVRENAQSALAKEGAQAFDELLARLSSKEMEVRWRAAVAIGQIVDDLFLLGLDEISEIDRVVLEKLQGAVQVSAVISKINELLKRLDLVHFLEAHPSEYARIKQLNLRFWPENPHRFMELLKTADLEKVLFCAAGIRSGGRYDCQVALYALGESTIAFLVTRLGDSRNSPSIQGEAARALARLNVSDSRITGALAKAAMEAEQMDDFSTVTQIAPAIFVVAKREQDLEMESIRDNFLVPYLSKKQEDTNKYRRAQAEATLWRLSRDGTDFKDLMR